MAKIIIDAEGSTTVAERLLERINLDDVSEVVIQKQCCCEGGPADVTFCLPGGYYDEVIVQKGFGIGYPGTGPAALVKILKRIGFSDAERVFSCRREKLVLFR